jgi:hypothetical protein
MKYLCFFSKVECEYYVFNISYLTEEIMNHHEFANKFTPVNFNPSNSSICSIQYSIEEYNSKKNEFIKIQKYNDFVNKEAQLAFYEEHGNNYKGPSNIFTNYINDIKAKYPIHDFV